MFLCSFFFLQFTDKERVVEDVGILSHINCRQWQSPFSIEQTIGGGNGFF